MIRTRWIKTSLMVALIAAVSGLVYAQQADPGRGDRNRGENRREARGEGRTGGGDMRTEFRQRMNDRIKESLAATDDEWKVIQPRLEKVQTLSMQTRMGGMMGGMMGGRGGRGGEGGGPGAGAQTNPAQQNEVTKAAQELRTALEDKGTGNETIKVKVEALRKAREKAKEELTKAQKELREILTARQEAQLIVWGLLD